MAGAKIQIPSWLRPIIIAVVDPIIRQRVLHVPEAELPADAAAAGVTPEQWRAVEAQQVNKLDIELMGL